MAFEQENFLKAERFWKKAQLELSQAPTPDERLAKLSQQLGQTYFKLGKFPLAETFYKQSLEVSKQLTLDQSEISAKIKELDSVYRPINLQSFDETATSFAKEVGALDACAVNQNETHHVDINLEKRYQKKVKELAESFLPKNADGSVATPDLDKAVPEGAPPIKQLRLDKKITFDLLPSQDGSVKLSNIQGISFDVGLWARLKELVMMQNAQNTPEVEVTAGAFGVEKKVKTTLPQNLYDRLKEGIAKFDPFSQKTASSNLGSSNVIKQESVGQVQATIPSSDAPASAQTTNP